MKSCDFRGLLGSDLKFLIAGTDFVSAGNVAVVSKRRRSSACWPPYS